VAFHWNDIVVLMPLYLQSSSVREFPAVDGRLHSAPNSLRRNDQCLSIIIMCFVLQRSEDPIYIA